MNKNIIYTVGGIFVSLVLVTTVLAQGGVFEYRNIYPPEEEELTACTADAMQCPDGSWVGRSGPNCEFKCGDDTPPSSIGTLRALPSSGSAPLSVAFEYAVGGLTVPESSYRMDFGDGTTGSVVVGCASNGSRGGACGMALTASHTYRVSGTYTASLVYDPCPATMEPRCMAPVEIKGSVKITAVTEAPRPGGFPGDPDKNSGDEPGVEEPAPGEDPSGEAENESWLRVFFRSVFSFSWLPW